MQNPIFFRITSIKTFCGYPLLDKQLNDAILADPDLIPLAKSSNPKAIAQAIEIASSRVELARFRAREKELADGDAALEAERAKLKKHKEELNLEPASAAAGRTQAGVPRKPGASVAEIVDSEWPAGAVSLIS